MSRILVLLPDVPDPLDAGARIRNHGLLRLLSAEHEVDAIAFGGAGTGAAMAGLVRRSAVVPMPGRRSVGRRVLDVTRTGLPDMALRRFSVDFRDTLKCFLEEGNYAAVQAEGIEMAGYLAGVLRAHRVYDAHNAEFMLQRRFATSATTLFARLYSRVQWRRLERFERQVVRASRLTLAVSHHDANQLIALAGSAANVQVVRNGIDTARFPFAGTRSDQSPDLLFLGKLDFRPNAESLAWFMHNVFKPLVEEVPEVRLFAVGASPPRWLVGIGQHHDRVAVTGYVADERPYLDRCAALILPIQAGGGSRLKALVALARGLPIVSTRVGMEGLEVEPNIHYLPAESPADWVHTLKRLLGDAALRQRMAQAGRLLVEQHYDWSAIHAEVRTAYDWLGA
ncbi:MAG: glycosyltransferase family 4 protein [Chloroflexi bacterium]|nr:glycosyltransferase family 4 protein [Chloroflexota bacterium]